MLWLLSLTRETGGRSSYTCSSYIYILFCKNWHLILWAYSGYWDLQLFPRWFVNWRHDDTWHTWWSFHLDWSVCGIKRETKGIWHWPGINWSPDFIQVVSSCYRCWRPVNCAVCELCGAVNWNGLWTARCWRPVTGGCKCWEGGRGDAGAMPADDCVRGVATAGRGLWPRGRVHHGGRWDAGACWSGWFYNSI